MATLSQQRAAYALATTLNHHTRTGHGGGETHNPAAVNGVVCQNLARCTVNTSLPDTDSKNTTNYTKRPDQHHIDTHNDTWEDARLKRAIERGYEYVAPNPHVALSATTDTDCLRTDGELARIAVGLRQSAQLRLWIILQEYARETGYNHLTRSQLATLLDQYHVRYSWQNLHRWLRQGQGVWWSLHNDTVWMIGYERVSVALVNLALTTKTKRGKSLSALVSTNAPGFFRPVYIKVASHNLEQFEAACYSAWLTIKGCPTISRYTLALLFNRTAKILQKYERLTKIVILHNFIHYTESTSNYVPEARDGGYRGDVLTYTVNGRKRWSAEYSNTYQPQPTKQHDKRGQSRRVSITIRKLLESIQSASTIAQIPFRDGGLHRTGRKLYDDGKKALKNASATQPLFLLQGIDNRRGVHRECVVGRSETRFEDCARASVALEAISVRNL